MLFDHVVVRTNSFVDVIDQWRVNLCGTTTSSFVDSQWAIQLSKNGKFVDVQLTMVR